MVGGASGAQRLNVYSERGYSSVIELADRYKRLWRRDVELDYVLEGNRVTLDSFVAEHPDRSPDFLKSTSKERSWKS
jgi:hypothetical protein